MQFAADSMFSPQLSAVEKRVTVLEDISVLEIAPTEAGTRLGRLMTVPKGASLDICGGGFNHRTVKARYSERVCFVFLRDLESGLGNGVPQH